MTTCTCGYCSICDAEIAALLAELAPLVALDAAGPMPRAAADEMAWLTRTLESDYGADDPCGDARRFAEAA